MAMQIGVVLAGGKGTRMKSDRAKVLHPVLGKSMIARVLEALSPLALDRVIVVAGHQIEAVQAHLATLNVPFPVQCVLQAPQLGTGHALMQVVPELPVSDPQYRDARILVTCADMPLVPSARYQALLQAHATQSAKATMVTVAMPDPTGYGRVVCEGETFVRIVEEKDASDTIRAIPWVNAGIYVFEWEAVAPCLERLTSQNAQQEYYLTDVPAQLIQEHGPAAVQVTAWPDPQEILGINHRGHLAEATRILSDRTAQRLMQEGVTLVQPHTSTLAPEIQVAPDTVLHPGCVLEGTVHIGARCEIGPFTTMRGAITVADDCRVIYAYLDRGVSLGTGTYVGPFAHLRDNAVIGQNARLGNFVEVKETRFGDRSAAAHLCYLGDAVIGADVNMGAGAIIANYDPILDQKHTSTLADGVKVGCNSVLVSPVTVGERACIAAGSVITRDVAPWSLAIARERQIEKADWVRKALSQTI